MTLCVNPECKQPNNPDTSETCASCGSKLWLLERYRTIKVIGKGGFGQTFLAIDECLPSKPHCAVKQLNFTGREPQLVNKAMALFEQEAYLLESLGNHTQIPSLFAFFTQNNRVYIVQEFIQGRTLEQELSESGIFSEIQIRQLLENILPVLQFVHEKNVLHRDIKPPNIIIRTSHIPEGSGYCKPVLIDFGVAKVLQSTSLIEPATALGTLHYAAPEQLQGAVCQGSDLYSLGVTCINLITGIKPIKKMYDSASFGWLWRQFIRSDNAISEGLGQVLDKLLHFQPQQRYQSAAEVLSVIASLEQVAPLDTLPAISKDILSPIGVDSTPVKTEPDFSLQRIGNDSSNNKNRISQLGINYIRLEVLLETQKWKEADIQTWKLLCIALEKPTSTKIISSEFSLIDCEHLLKIDQLWIRASNNKFGFSIQDKIFESVDKDYIKFCQHVKWQSYDSTSYHLNLNFSNQAPPGHLPSRIWAEGDKFWRHLNAIAIKLAQCTNQV